jgi:hypothetical protein
MIHLSSRKTFLLVLWLTALFAIGELFYIRGVEAAENYTQTIALRPGWNIVSTPRVLSSHVFSIDETSLNFDIYTLNPANPSG